MSLIEPEAGSNRLLAMLDAETLQRLMPSLDRVSLENRRKVFTAGHPLDHAYFPLSCMISMVSTLSDGMQAEVGLIGPEGVAGITLVSGAQSSFVDAMVQAPGLALRMEAQAFRRFFTAEVGFRSVLLRFYAALQAQIMQTAVCNGRHELERRLARWLLMCHDRHEGDTLPLTHDFIAAMLGAHRPSVTVAARALQRAELITYGSGRITITDRPGLERASCECYGVVRRRLDELMQAPEDPAGPAPAA